MASGATVTVSNEDWDRIGKGVRKLEHMEPPPEPTDRRGHVVYPPNIGGILMADLHTGGEVEMAVLRRDRSTEVQIVSIVGFHGDYTTTPNEEERDPGSFRLRFSPTDDYVNESAYRDSGPIFWNATADQVRDALLQMGFFSRGDIDVTFGFPGEPDVDVTGNLLGRLTDDESGVINTSHLGRWIVRIGGKWLGKDVPLMKAVEDEDNNLAGYQEAQVTGTNYYEWTGRTETIYGFLPCGIPGGATPLRRGAYCIAAWLDSIGYAPTAIEPRDFWPAPIDLEY